MAAHGSVGGVSQKFDRPIPKLHLKAISAERKRSKKDRMIYDEFKLKLSKLETTSVNKTDGGIPNDYDVPNEYDESIEERAGANKKCINIKTANGGPGVQKQSEQSVNSIRENEWHEL